MPPVKADELLEHSEQFDDSMNTLDNDAHPQCLVLFKWACPGIWELSEDLAMFLSSTSLAALATLNCQAVTPDVAAQLPLTTASILPMPFDGGFPSTGDLVLDIGVGVGSCVLGYLFMSTAIPSSETPTSIESSGIRTPMAIRWPEAPKPNRDASFSVFVTTLAGEQVTISGLQKTFTFRTFLGQVERQLHMPEYSARLAWGTRTFEPRDSFKTLASLDINRGAEFSVLRAPPRDCHDMDEFLARLAQQHGEGLRRYAGALRGSRYAVDSEGEVNVFMPGLARASEALSEWQRDR